MLTFRCVSAGYYGKQILQDISFECKAGEITSIIGSNGSGKSTLFRVATRAIPPMAGEVELEGKGLREYKPKELARHLAILPQVRDVPSISAYSLVLHGRFPYMGFPRVASGADKAAVARAMDMVGVSAFRDVNIAELSGGERQRVYFAMLLAQDTKTVLLDEPTTYLDLSYQYEFLDILSMLKAEGKAVAVVLHDVAQAMAISDQIVLLGEGKARYIGDSAGLYESGALERYMKIRPHKSEDGGYYFSPCREENIQNNR